MIKKIPIDKIILPKNWKTLVKERNRITPGVNELATNIEKHGLISPPIVNLCAGEYYLANGLTRIMAYKKLGIVTIPVQIIKTALPFGYRKSTYWEACKNSFNLVKKLNNQKPKIPSREWLLGFHSGFILAKLGDQPPKPIKASRNELYNLFVALKSLQSMEQ